LRGGSRYHTFIKRMRESFPDEMLPDEALKSEAKPREANQLLSFERPLPFGFAPLSPAMLSSYSLIIISLFESLITISEKFLSLTVLNPSHS
jgi:hypothetical protein